MKHAVFKLSLVSVMAASALASVFVGCSSSTTTPADTDGGDETPVPSKCPTPTGPAVEHQGTIAADETWGPGLHRVKSMVTVGKKATLTIAPCAVVKMAAGTRFLVGGTVAGEESFLVASGKADEPIVIEAETDTKWNDLLVYPKGKVTLAYTTLRGGGGPDGRDGATLHLFGDANAPPQALASVDHVTIEGSERYGVYMETHGAFTSDSHDLVVRGSGEMPVRTTAATAYSVPTGKYTGNATDAMRLVGSQGYDMVTESTVFHDRGVPYVVGGDRALPEIPIVGANGPATLTLEAGVTLKFITSDRASGIWVDRGTSNVAAKGILKIAGTADRKVTLTSAEATPKPGDWVGIVFGNQPSSENSIENAVIEYAGGDTGTRGFSCGTPGSDDPISNEAAITILGEPSRAFVTGTRIAHSAKNGIERGWTGRAVDFLPGNTFEDVANCKQTRNRIPDTQCPSPPVCD